jgi:opacity protein-like surface antigen
MKNIVKLFTVVIAVLFVANLSYGQANIGFKGIGGKVGLVMPEDPIESTFGLGVVANLGTITPDIHLDAFIDFWSKSYDSGTGLGYTAEWSITEIVIGAAAKYYFPMEGSKFKPFAGGGLGLVYGKSKWEASGTNVGLIGGGSFSSSDTEIGFRILGGADLELSPGLSGFAEAAYHIGGIDFFGISVGIIKMLGE